MENRKKKIKCEIYRDSMQNYKKYAIPPAQKPVNVIKQLIEIFTDAGDVVIDPCCGSGTTLRAAYELGRSSYGFEIDRTFYTRARDEMLIDMEDSGNENN